MKIEHIKEVVVFDFDKTLINTLEPEEGKKIWKEKTGEDYPHHGWWGKKESLDINVFDNEPYEDIVAEYNKVANNPSVYVALCTGRITRFTDEVNAILNKYNLVFDEVVLNGDRRFTQKGADNNTLAFKIRYFADLVRRFPNLESMEIWDDRIEHHGTFVQWAKLQKVPVTVHLVKH